MTQSSSSTKYIDYLSEDPPIPGQLWTCISFLSPEGIKNCSLRGLKIRGVFGTKPEADKYAEELQKIDSDFHVFVGEMGKWLPWDPDPNDIKDNIYQEKELNDLMKGYKDNLDKAKKMQQDRKESMIREGAKQEQSNLKKSKTEKIEKTGKTDKVEGGQTGKIKNSKNNVDQAKDRLRKQLEDKRQQNVIINTKKDDDDMIEINTVDKKQLSEKEQELNKIEEIVKNEEELAKAELSRINETKKEINNTTQNLETIDSKLAKIQELYEKLNKKK
jgi:hypothetical protein